MPDPDAALQKQLARLAYRKGKLLDEYNAIDAGADRKVEIFKAYDLAVTGDPNNAEYLAARGLAGLDLEPPQVDWCSRTPRPWCGRIPHITGATGCWRWRLWPTLAADTIGQSKRR